MNKRFLNFRISKNPNFGKDNVHVAKHIWKVNVDYLIVCVPDKVLTFWRRLDLSLRRTVFKVWPKIKVVVGLLL